MRVCQSVVVGERAAAPVDDGKFSVCVYSFLSLFSQSAQRASDPSFFLSYEMMMMVLLALEAIKYVDIHGSFFFFPKRDLEFASSPCHKYTGQLFVLIPSCVSQKNG